MSRNFWGSFFGGLLSISVWYWAYVRGGLHQVEAYLAGAVVSRYTLDDEEDPDDGVPAE